MAKVWPRNGIRSLRKAEPSKTKSKGFLIAVDRLVCLRLACLGVVLARVVDYMTAAANLQTDYHKKA